MATKVKATAAVKATANGLDIAAHNNDSVTVIGWNLPQGQIIKNCLGFSLTRIDEKGVREILQTYLPPKGVDNKDWKSQPSNVWPIQRTWWVDFTGRKGKTYTYEVEAMGGAFGALTPMAGLKGTSNAITLTVKVDETFDIAFTRGVLSTQWLARQIGLDKEGNPNFQKIVDSLADYKTNDIIRQTLMGNVPELLMAQVNEAAANGGHVDLALYELSCAQLVDFLKENIKHWSLILGNTGADDETNKLARAALHSLKADITDRFVGTWGIPHNKFQVLLDALLKPLSYTTGSTNWTDTGLGCQSNMAIRIRNAQAAGNVLDYWNRLLEDTKLGTANLQSLAFRRRNAQGYAPITMADGVTVLEQYFQPSLDEKTKPKDGTLSPFLKRVKGLIEEFAGYGDSVICGEVFYPGNPSVVQWFADAWNASPTNCMFMTVSQAPALAGVSTKRRKGRPPLFTIATGREKDFAEFVKELLKLPDAHAITHGKIVVLMNFRLKKFVVIGGSDNLGLKASAGNDENAFIIIGNEKVAWYTFVNMFDINQHYLGRAAARATKTVKTDSGWTGALATDDSWQNAWLSPYKVKLTNLLATGVWDGTGLVDPAGLKPVPCLPPPKKKPTTGKAAGAVGPTDGSADASTEAGSEAKPAKTETTSEKTAK